MATRTTTITTPDQHLGPGRTVVGTATGMLNGDDCTGVPLIGYGELSLSVTGTFGAGGSVALEGSIDGSTWFGLKNRAGTAIAITAASLDVSGPLAARFARARVTAGDGTTNLITTLFARSRA